MATYLPTKCPIFWEELRRRLRGGRGQGVLLIYTFTLVMLLTMVTLVESVDADPSSWPQYGKTLWALFFFGQLTIISVISPGLTAGAICAEREQGTLELLILTRMSSLSIVLGKFLGALGQMFLIVLAGLPIISVVFFFGGVSPKEMVQGYALIFSTGIGLASLGFLMSCLFKRMAGAVTWAYGSMVIVLLILPLVLGLLLEASGESYLIEVLLPLLAVINPFVAAAAFLSDSAPSSMYIGLWPTMLFNLTMAVLVLAECTMIVRRLRGMSKRFIPKTLQKPVRDSERQVTMQE